MGSKQPICIEQIANVTESQQTSLTLSSICISASLTGTNPGYAGEGYLWTEVQTCESIGIGGGFGNAFQIKWIGAEKREKTKVIDTQKGLYAC